MPNVSSRFTSFVGTPSNITNADALLVDGNSFNCNFTGGAEFELNNFPSGVGPNAIPSTATLTGIQNTIVISSLSSGLTITVKPKFGASQFGSDQVYTFSSPGGIIKGGSTDDMGLPSANFTPSGIQTLRFEVTVSSFSGTSTLQKLNSFLPIIHYTLPHSNKVYNTSGKVSITSGKVSIT